MNKNKAKILFSVIGVLISSLSCAGSFSTANIDSAWMATDESGNTPTAVFSQDAVFFAMVDLKNASDETKLKAVWTAVDAEDTDPNFVITETEFTSGDGLIHFQLENTDFLWPIGQYKVDIYLNDALDQTLTFSVQ